MEAPRCLVEVSARTIGVHHLDDSLRDVLTCVFREIDPRHAFLVLATRREFHADGRIAASLSFVFDRHGRTDVRREWYDPLRVEFDCDHVDVRANLTVKPAFCQYDELIGVPPSLLALRMIGEAEAQRLAIGHAAAHA